MPLTRRPWTVASAALAAVGLVFLMSTAGAAGPTGPVRPSVNINRPVPAGATLLPNGRLVSPGGRNVDLGDFPVGVAVSPDGRLAAAPGNGQGKGFNDGFGSLCQDPGKPNQCGYVPADKQGDPRTPAPDETIQVTDLTTGGRTSTPVTTVPTSSDPAHPQLNFFAMGVVFSPDGRHLYATGGGNDALYDFAVTGSGLASPPARTVYLQNTSVGPSAGGTYQSPRPGTAAAQTKGLALTPDGAFLLVVKEQLNALDVVRTSDLSLVQELFLAPPTGVFDTGGIGTSSGYPYAVVIGSGGTSAYVSMQGYGAVERLSLAPDGHVALTGAVGVGDHPTGLAVAGGATPQLLVTNANDDTVSVLTITGPVPAVAQTLTLHALAGEQVGSVPNAVAVSHDGTRAYVALASDDALGVLDRTATGWAVHGYLPTGWYPVAVAVRPGTGEPLVVSAKGLGSRYVAGQAYPVPSLPGTGPAVLPTPYYYDGNNMPGHDGRP